MNRYILLFCISFPFLYVYSQDTLTIRPSEVLEVKILEQTDQMVKFRPYYEEDGPIIGVKTSRIESIKYESGRIELLGNKNPRTNRSVGISTGLMLFLTEESGYIFVRTNYFIVPQVDVHLTLGSELEGGSYFAAGADLHLNSKFSVSKFTPYTGLRFGSEYGSTFLQVPLGVSYLGYKGFNLSFGLSQVFYTHDNWQSTLAELSLGWRFKL